MMLPALVLLLSISLSIPDWLTAVAPANLNTTQKEAIVVLIVRMEGCSSCRLQPKSIKEKIDTWASKNDLVVHYVSLVVCQRQKDVRFITKNNATFGTVVADVSGIRAREISGNDGNVSAVVFHGNREKLIRTQSDINSL